MDNTVQATQEIITASPEAQGQAWRDLQEKDLWAADVAGEFKNLKKKLKVPDEETFRDHYKGDSAKLAKDMVDKLGYVDAIRSATARCNINPETNEFFCLAQEEIKKLKPEEMKEATELQEKDVPVDTAVKEMEKTIEKDIEGDKKFVKKLTDTVAGKVETDIAKDIIKNLPKVPKVESKKPDTKVAGDGEALPECESVRMILTPVMAEHFGSDKWDVSFAQGGSLKASLMFESQTKRKGATCFFIWNEGKETDGKADYCVIVGPNTFSCKSVSGKMYTFNECRKIIGAPAFDSIRKHAEHRLRLGR